MLSLQTEEEGRGEAPNIINTINMILRLVISHVTMNQGYQIPEHSEHDPGDVEWCAETEERPEPGQLYGWGEEILEQSVLFPCLIGVGEDVDSPMLRHHAVLLWLCVHHLHQSWLLTKWIPTETSLNILHVNNRIKTFSDYLPVY